MSEKIFVSLEDTAPQSRFVGQLVNEGQLKREQKFTNTKAAEMKFLLQQLNISQGMDKFRDKDGNWRENIQRVEEDIPKVVGSYNVLEDDTERGKVKFEREQEWAEGPMA